MEQATLSRRERHKEHTRLAIHHAALDLVEERGMAAVTVDAISERADVSARTFSNYFAGKEDAVLGLEPNTAERLSGDLAERLAGQSPFEALRDVLVEHMMGRYHTAESAARRVRVVSREPQLKARMAGQFDALASGMVKVIAAHLEVDPEVDLYPTLLVSAAANAARAALLWWSIHPDRRPLEDVFSQAFGQLAAGLGSPVRDRGVSPAPRSSGKKDS